MIQAAALKNLGNISDKLQQEYENMSWIKQKWYASEGFYVKSKLIDVKDETLKPIENSIRDFLRAAGISDDTWLTSVANNAINDHTHDDTAKINYPVKNDMDDVINSMLHDLGIPGYVSGGFPGEDGLFYANHEELIGKFINGKTAVANNYQITEGIKQAVLEALQTAGGMDGGNWTIQVVDTDGNIKAEQIISAAERRNRRDGRTILPLGD